MKYIAIAAAERLIQKGRIISIWKNSGVIFLKKTGKIMCWIFAKNVMINGAAVLQARNKILAGESPCFFFEKKMSQTAFFADTCQFLRKCSFCKELCFSLRFGRFFFSFHGKNGIIPMKKVWFHSKLFRSNKKRGNHHEISD